MDKEFINETFRDRVDTIMNYPRNRANGAFLELDRARAYLTKCILKLGREWLANAGPLDRSILAVQPKSIFAHIVSVIIDDLYDPALSGTALANVAEKLEELQVPMTKVVSAIQSAGGFEAAFTRTVGELAKCWGNIQSEDPDNVIEPSFQLSFRDAMRLRAGEGLDPNEGLGLHYTLWS